MMEHRKIGSLSVSLAGIGCNNFGWRIDAAATQAVVDAALDSGINFFDTADVYGSGQSEEFLGKAIHGRRDKVIIATKFGMKMGHGMEGARSHYIEKALEDSLRRLGVDYIDLYQLHRPDPDTPILDTMEALNKAVKAGKVREIGCSNFSVEQMQTAHQSHGPKYFASVQNEYSLFKRDSETNGVLAECAKTGVGFLPYFPLANGLLTGKYRKGQPLPEGSRATDGFGPKVFTDENLDRVEKMIAYAESRGHTLLELGMSWLAAHPEVSSVIAGAKTPEQVRANAAAVDWKLSAEELEAISRL
jgi:aryl-alcohol dehydrogenase-like predicted oxidoreductase